MESSSQAAGLLLDNFRAAILLPPSTCCCSKHHTKQVDNTRLESSSNEAVGFVSPANPVFFNALTSHWHLCLIRGPAGLGCFFVCLPVVNTSGT